MSEVATIEPQELALPAADPMISMIERVVMNPDLPMERVTAMFELRERQMAKEAEQEFNRSFAAAMANMPDVPRSGENKHLKTKYSTLDDLIRTTRPVLSSRGLSLNWQTVVKNNELEVSAIVRHESGHFIKGTLVGPRDTNKTMNVLQGGGSTETYLKRYTGFAILGLSSGDEVDDDGQLIGASTPLTQDQYITLRDMLDESGLDEVVFFKGFKIPNPESADLHQFPAAYFDEAMARLKKYKEKQAQ